MTLLLEMKRSTIFLFVLHLVIHLSTIHLICIFTSHLSLSLALSLSLSSYLFVCPPDRLTIFIYIYFYHPLYMCHDVYICLSGWLYFLIDCFLFLERERERNKNRKQCQTNWSFIDSIQCYVNMSGWLCKKNSREVLPYLKCGIFSI